MKKMLLCLSLLYSLPTLSAEVRSLGLNRHSGALTTLSPVFRKVLDDRFDPEALNLVQVSVIETAGPYEFAKSTRRARPAILDDLYFESLLLPDPLQASEDYYPLIAQAVRLGEDFAVFELDARARFHDGSAVTANDVVASIDLMLEAQPQVARLIKSAVTNIEAKGSEVRVNLRADAGQLGRDALVALATAKIVKRNVINPRLVGGVELPFQGTGPYRVAVLGRARLELIADPNYWGRMLSTRKGFFHFRQVNLLAFADEASARQSLASLNGAFFPNPADIAALAKQFKQRQGLLERYEEDRRSTSLKTLQFNLKREATADHNVRQVLILAYPFEAINTLYFGGSLVRPKTILHGSNLAPQGQPSMDVNALLIGCGPGAPADLNFEVERLGNALAAGIEDVRVRLLTAQSLLFTAGYRLVNFRMVKGHQNQPLSLKLILLPSTDPRPATLFQRELEQMGIQLSVVRSQTLQHYHWLKQSGDYDLIESSEQVMGNDSVVRTDLAADLLAHDGLTCAEGIQRRLRENAPNSRDHQLASEALARLHQSLRLSVYTGEPAKNTSVVDVRVQSPGDLPMQRIHMYGFWYDASKEPQPHFDWPSHCYNLSCMFGD